MCIWIYLQRFSGELINKYYQATIFIEKKGDPMVASIFYNKILMTNSCSYLAITLALFFAIPENIIFICTIEIMLLTNQ
jgi:hypothetical protein